MNNLQSKVLSVVAWFFGVIFIMGALGAFLEGSLVAGLLMLVAGILFLPPIKRLILDKQPNLSKGKITAAGTILVVISFFFLPLDTEVTDEDQDLTSESAAETKQDALEPEPTTEVVKKKEPVVEVATIPVEKKPIEEPKPTIEEAKTDKPVEVIKTVPSEPSKTEKRQDIDPVKARAILEKVDQEVRAAKGFDIENKVEVAKKSRRMKALLEEETAPFGDENGEVGRLCDSTRRQAFTYWLQVFSERNKKDPQMTKDMLKYYEDSKKPCLDAIKDFENS